MLCKARDSTQQQQELQKEASLSCMVCPCAGMRPVRLFVDEHMVRAWPGGAGDVKIASNYAPTVEPLVAAARDYGASQSLFVLPQGPDRDQAVLSEAGGMNFFAHIDKVSCCLTLTGYTCVGQRLVCHNVFELDSTAVRRSAV